MYEDMTSDYILKRMLYRASSKFDKREGSILYDACAPSAFELAEAYIMARVILKQTFATTADRPYLALRAAEFRIFPEEATKAEVRGVFSIEVPIGTRFNAANGYNYITQELLDDSTHAYKLTCETAGRLGNNCVGSVAPIDPINGLTSAEITEVIKPGEDEEDTEAFRQRYFEALKSIAYGGNGADYKEKTLAVEGIGGVKAYRCWNGGGTVGLVVLNTEYDTPTAEMLEEVQNVFDPPSDAGLGYGLAPIGHTVTVFGATSVTINVTAIVKPRDGYTLDTLINGLKGAVDAYLLTLRKEWTKQTEKEYLTVRAAYILTALLAVTGVNDVTSLLVNGSTEKIVLNAKEVPVTGELTWKETKSDG